MAEAPVCWWGRGFLVSNSSWPAATSGGLGGADNEESMILIFIYCHLETSSPSWGAIDGSREGTIRLEPGSG